MKKKTNQQLIEELEILKGKIKDLERNKEISEIIAENTSDNIAITTFDLKAEYIYVSPSVKQILGYDPIDMIGRSFFDFIHPDDKKIIFPLLKKYISQIIKKVLRIDDSNLVETLEFRFKDKAGNWRNMQSTVNFVGSDLLAVTRDITERKKTERKLIKSENLYRSLFNSANDAIFIMHGETFTDCNKQTLTMFGCKHEEIIGHSPIEFSPPTQIDGRKSSEKAMEKINAAIMGEPQFFEWQHKKLNGTIFDAEVSLNTLNIQNKKYIQAIVRDITNRKQSELAIQEAEENLRSLFNAMIDTVFEIDYDGQYINIAPTSLAFVYKPYNEIINKTFHDLFPKDEADRFLTFVRNCLNENKADLIEYSIVINDETIWFEGRATPKTSNSILFIARDITHNKKIEQEIKESQNRFKVFKETTNEGIFLVDNGIVVDINAAAISMLGYSNDEIVSKPIMNFIADESKELVTKNMLSGYNEPYDAIALCNDGIKVHIEVVGRELIYKGKSMRMSTVRDITDRKNAEKVIRKHNYELQERNTELDAFSHTVAHDLKNPLGSISGFADLLHNRYAILSNEEIEKYIKAIIDSNKKALQIINSLLLFASVRKEEINTEEINMGHIVDEALVRFELKINKTNASITFPKNWPTVIGFFPWVEEVWTNYISNALKYGGSPPVIEIGFDTEKSNDIPKGMVRFWIRDNGLGLTKENQKVIFKKFERLDQTRTQGHGLGLSITQRIIEKLGGEVGLESKFGEGSLFYFTLPTTNQNIPTPKMEHKNLKHVTSNLKPANLKPANKKPSNLKILIAEDEQTSDDLLTIVMQSISKEILHTRDGKETIEVCRNNPDLNLILMDIRMPILSGYKATQEIRKFNKDIIIIAQTAFALEGDYEKAIEVGCNEHITKPIDIDKLMKTINKFFSN